MNQRRHKQRDRKPIHHSLGPGLITGASDDDPSGIATYSSAGAAYGFTFLWTSIVTFPLMATLQEMCARIGLVTGHGLAGIVKRNYPRWLLYTILLICFPAIILNIGADLAGMGAVAHMMYPDISDHEFSFAFMFIILFSIVYFDYHRIARILKWLCITLLCYCIVPFIIHVEWKEVMIRTFVPSLQFNSDYMIMLTAILGTTISPYLFFWQTTSEAEEKSGKRIMVDKQQIEEMRFDVRTGIGFSNLVFYFIILTAGSVLYPHGIREINTVEDAASALAPIAGKNAYLLFSIGVIGTGFLAIPVLAGSISYAISETFGWKEGLSRKFYEARNFYLVIFFSLVVALSIQFMSISPVKALFYTAVAYGVTCPVTIALILHICNNKKIMGNATNGKLSNFIGVITLILMAAVVVLLL